MSGNKKRKNLDTPHLEDTWNKFQKAKHDSIAAGRVAEETGDYGKAETKHQELVSKAATLKTLVNDEITEIERLKKVIQAESDAARLEAQRVEAKLTALRKELDKAHTTKEALSGIIRSCTGSSVIAPCLCCGGWHKYNSESSKKPFYCTVCSSKQQVPP